VKSRHRIATLAATTALAAGLTPFVLTTGATASPPPFESDPNALGRVVFYDSTGHVLTGGSNLKHLADYVAATTADTTASTKATFFFAAPDHTQPDTSQWATFDQSLSTTFPSATAPAPVTGPGFTNPLVTLGAGDADFSDFVGGVAPDNTAGYANVFQVRIYTTKSSPKYWESDIQVDQNAGTWQVVDPTVTTTTTTVSGSPAGGADAGSPTTVTPGADLPLTATVSPAENGTVQFYDHTTATAVGTAQAVTTGNGVAHVTANPDTGTHDYFAVFTPTGGTLVQDSTSAHTFYQAIALTATHTTITASQASSQQFGYVDLKATVSEDDSPTTTGEAGTVTFSATPQGGGTATTLGSTSTDDGTTGEYALHYRVTLPVGAYDLTATFVPSAAGYAQSTSGTTPLTVTQAPPQWQPILSGPHRIGSVDSCLASFGGATSVTYAWSIDGSTIAGATASTYRIADAYYGKHLTCTVTASNSAGLTTGTSNASVVGTGAALVATAKPYVYRGSNRSTAAVGVYEYCYSGRWSPAATSYSFQWYVGSTAIRGATTSRFRPPAAYRGKVISCVVVAHRLHYANGVVHTAAVKVL
jgi:hypothetical protein